MKITNTHHSENYIGTFDMTHAGLFAYETWRANYDGDRVPRRRFRGPRRIGRNGKVTHAGQSMCLLKDATHFDVYLYKD